MSSTVLPLMTRLCIAWKTVKNILFDSDYAANIRDVSAKISPRLGLANETEQNSSLIENSPDSALQLLRLLQRDGRFIDFIEEDVAHFSDQEIGAATRLVHQGCRKVLHAHFKLEPIRSESEGEKITLEAGFDASSINLTGNVVGEPPFQGTLTHQGWRAIEITLPKLTQSHDVTVLTAAEVEL